MTLLPLHIIAGLLALLSGAVAMIALKGDQLHRQSGRIFVLAMLVMSSSAVLIAAFFSPNRMNMVAGGLTFYLVCTGLLTVRRPVAQSRGWLVACMVLAVAVGAFALGVGFEKLTSADGASAAPFFFVFGTVALLGAGLDMRLLRAGDIQGGQRLVRHLWRMGLAMWIATLSAFLGQARHFPEPIRKSGLLAVPVLLVALFILYWLGRLLWQRRRARAAAPALRMGYDAQV